MDQGTPTTGDIDLAAVSAWVAGGDREALQTVFERHAPAALRLATHRLGNQSDADDAVQQAFIGFMRGARGIRPGAGTVRGYIMASVLNACAEQRRREGSRRAREAVSSPPPAPAVPDPDLRDSVQRALALLPEHQRLPVELRYLAGLDYPEIAAALGRKERTVRGQVDRGLDALRVVCARFGLSSTTAGIALALIALPSAAPSAETVARCSSVATRGPKAVGVSSARLMVCAAASVAIAVMALLSAIAPVALVVPVVPAAIPPAPTLPATPAPIADGAVRERMIPGVFWDIPDLPSTRDVPVLAVGAARDPSDARGLGIAWRTPPIRAIDEDWWSNPLVKAREVRADWTPTRLLRAARPGDECYAVCVAPAGDAEWQLSFVPRAVTATPDGWLITCEGQRIARSQFSGGLTRGRSASVISLGRLPARGARIVIDVRWHDLIAATSLYRDDKHRALGALEVAGDPAADGAPAAVAALAREPIPSKRQERSGLAQMILPMRVMQMAAADAPARFGGIVNTSQRGWACFDAAIPRVAGSAVQVLGPLMSANDAITLRSVRWDGDVATATVAIWSSAPPAPEAERRRPLLPVWLERPDGVTGLVTVVLNWEHYVAEVGSGDFVRQVGPPEFAGTTRVIGVDLPDPTTPDEGQTL